MASAPSSKVGQGCPPHGPGPPSASNGMFQMGTCPTTTNGQRGSRWSHAAPRSLPGPATAAQASRWPRITLRSRAGAQSLFHVPCPCPGAVSGISNPHITTVPVCLCVPVSVQVAAEGQKHHGSRSSPEEQPYRHDDRPGGPPHFSLQPLAAQNGISVQRSSRSPPERIPLNPSRWPM
ncbi:uncharacterized protein TRUGW13939_10189 [Talaromyces rugulosus]|uniref:Uncharacterized protein n=1 Tax=Talaromyces rugulosus TaxID=121627 RepID=A0A7H8RB49_TALRU|nr:uncharacterized protein TRUGW13939_10189 [Talaromyces rugulosus]QKX63021.1 hypothetical protein TRUGW13939_10189 [Talaromyces rugulosus]